MGDIADMMLDGTLCEGCGVFLGEASGHVRYCSKQCANDRGYSEPDSEKVKCPECGKRVKLIGLAQHLTDKHKIEGK